MLYLAVGETWGSSFTISVNVQFYLLVSQCRSLLQHFLVDVLQVNLEQRAISVPQREDEATFIHHIHKKRLLRNGGCNSGSSGIWSDNV